MDLTESLVHKILFDVHAFFIAESMYLGARVCPMHMYYWSVAINPYKFQVEVVLRVSSTTKTHMIRGALAKSIQLGMIQ